MDLQIKQHGVFPTPIKIFNDYIYENIKDKINDYVFVDMFCGSGNLILPILEHIEKDKRVEYFKEHIFMFDILEKEVKSAIKNSMNYGIPEDVAKEN
ncbi:MAG: N-6 DNA methylase, partial [Caldisericia bacterium]